MSGLSRFAAAIMLAALAGACQSDHVAVGSFQPDTVAERHPIQVKEGFATLDLLPGGGLGGLTDREAGDVRAFAAEWRGSGRGPILVKVPSGGASDVTSRFGLGAIRTALAASGVPPRAIVQRRYRASGPGHLAPVRLMFAQLQAGLPHPCGQWPTDNARSSGDDADTENRPYWNFGCAQQQNLAAEIDDPEDFIRPRAETAAYAPRRQTVIDKYAQGESTATTQSAGSQTKISEIGSGQ